MTTMTELVVAVDSRDPATGLAAVAALRRQSVHKKHARRV
jgi:hypothetical protein